MWNSIKLKWSFLRKKIGATWGEFFSSFDPKWFWELNYYVSIPGKIRATPPEFQKLLKHKIVYKSVNIVSTIDAISEDIDDFLNKNKIKSVVNISICAMPMNTKNHFQPEHIAIITYELSEIVPRGTSDCFDVPLPPSQQAI